MAFIEDLVAGHEVEELEIVRQNRLREVSGSDDGPYTGNGEGAAGIDLANAGVTMGTAEDGAVHHAGQYHVGAVAGPAGDFVGTVVTHGAFTDDAILLCGEYGVWFVM